MLIRHEPKRVLPPLLALAEHASRTEIGLVLLRPTNEHRILIFAGDGAVGLSVSPPILQNGNGSFALKFCPVCNSADVLSQYSNNPFIAVTSRAGKQIVTFWQGNRRYLVGRVGIELSAFTFPDPVLSTQ